MVRFMEMSEEKHASNIRWNFFATSHGKGAVDGVGGVLKRRAWNKGKTGGYPKCGGVYGRSERWRNHLQFSHRVSKRGDTCSWLGILCQYHASIWVRLPVASWSKR